jgi:hypothetical protein
MKKRMDQTGHKRAILLLLAVGATAAVGAFLFFGQRHPEGPSETGGPEATTLARLYFADPLEACLRVEQRRIVHGEGQTAKGEALVKALIQGPTRDLARTLSPNAAVKDVVVRKGVAYVDLTAAAVSEHLGGSESELLTVYSIVNTICLNMPELKAAKILIEGESAATFKGHMDLRFALKPDRTLIR